MDKLWLLFPTGIVSKLYCTAGDVQNAASNWLKLIEDKKMAAVDRMYREWHGEDENK